MVCSRGDPPKSVARRVGEPTHRRVLPRWLQAGEVPGRVPRQRDKCLACATTDCGGCQQTPWRAQRALIVSAVRMGKVRWVDSSTFLHADLGHSDLFHTRVLTSVSWPRRMRVLDFGATGTSLASSGMCSSVTAVMCAATCWSRTRADTPHQVSLGRYSWPVRFKGDLQAGGRASLGNVSGVVRVLVGGMTHTFTQPFTKPFVRELLH